MQQLAKRRHSTTWNGVHVATDKIKETEHKTPLLTSSIPKTQVDRLGVNHHVRRVVIEARGIERNLMTNMS